MENATDALKMAFAVLAFVLALTIAITMFSQLNEVSKIVISSSDITKYYEYKVAEDEKQTRIVGLETIIPTLYKYYKENYTVLFLDENGKPLKLYETQTDINLWSEKGIIGKYYENNNDNNPVCSFDVDEETNRHEPWTGNLSDYKENLDAFLYGGSFKYKSGGTDTEGREGYEYSGFIKYIEDYYSKLRDKEIKFKETMGEYAYDFTNTNSLLKNKKKRVIIYQLIKEYEYGR